jgi:mono/diheme cytochrome c family protein
LDRNPLSAIRCWRFALGAVLALLAPGAVAAQASTPAQSVEAGSRVFLDKGCSSCHAVNGHGGTVGPDLARRPGATRSFFHLAAAMWNHIPRMRREMDRRGVERPRLAPWEAADLVAFLYWANYFDEPGDAERGARLFRERQCMACHQVRGLGGVLGPDLGVLASTRTPIMIATGMWNHAAAMTDAMAARAIARPSFTGDELRDLFTYFEGPSAEIPLAALYVVPGQAERGRELFEQKRCAQCHGAREGGPGVGPELRVGRRYTSVLDFAAAMWNKGPRMIAAMRERDVRIPELDSREMADLVAFLYAGRYFTEAGDRARGGEVVRARCATCHGGPVARARDLARVRGLDAPAAVVAALWNHVTVPAEPGRWVSLTAESVADVTAYLQSLGATR